MLRSAKLADPVLQQCACNGGRHRVGHRNGFRSPRESVDDGVEMRDGVSQLLSISESVIK